MKNEFPPDPPLNYIPVLDDTPAERRRRRLAWWRNELSLFWSFLWRWLILYVPLWWLLNRLALFVLER